MTGAGAAPFLDTNYIVRYLMDDPPDMAARAASVIDGDERLTLSELVLVESAYVLTSVYGVERARLVDALIELVQKDNLTLANLTKPRVIEALRLCRDSKRFSFTDVLLYAEALDKGAEIIYSFDRRFPAHGLTVTGFE